MTPSTPFARSVLLTAAFERGLRAAMERDPELRAIFQNGGGR